MRALAFMEQEDVGGTATDEAGAAWSPGDGAESGRKTTEVGDGADKWARGGRERRGERRATLGREGVGLRPYWATVERKSGLR